MVSPIEAATSETEIDTMKTEKVSGNIETAYGQTLKTPVKYEGVADLYETPDEVRAANDWPSNDEIVSFVNRNRVQNQRAKLMKSALDAAGILKPTLEDPREQFKQMVKILTTAGKDEATAKTIANTTLGTSYTE
jgi:hypothetical protein